MIWLYIFTALILILVIILMSHTKIQLEIKVTSIHTKLRIDFVYIFLFKKVSQQYLVDLDFILNLLESYFRKSSDDEKEEDSWYRHFLYKLKYTQDNINTFYYYFRRLKVEELTWISTIGLGEADQTGFYSGSLWAFKGMCMSFLSKKAKLRDFRININPDFSNRILSSQFSCILRIRIVHIIPISISVLLSKARGYYYGIRKATAIKPSH